MLLRVGLLLGVFTLLVAHSPSASAVPLAPGDLVFASSTGLWRVTRGTGVVTQFSTATGTDVVVESPNQVLVRQQGGGGDRILRVDVATGAASTLATLGAGPGLPGASHLALDAAGQVYVDGFVSRVDPGTGALTPFGSIGSGIAVDTTGRVLTADATLVNGGADGRTTVYQAQPGGGLVALDTYDYPRILCCNIWDLEAGPAGTRYVLDPSPGLSRAADPTGNGGFRSFAVDLDGALLFLGADITHLGLGLQVLRYDPTTATRTTLFSNLPFAGDGDLAVVPVPEPRALALLAFGITALASLRRRPTRAR